MTPRALDAIQADTVLRNYRANHRIVPVQAEDDEPVGGWVCGYDGVRVVKIKGGWRHVNSEIRVLAEKVPLRFPS